VSKAHTPKAALTAWLAAGARTGDPVEAVRAAAEAVASDPWDVVVHAGSLARRRLTAARRDFGLTADLRPVTIASPSAVVFVEKGAPWPAPAPDARADRGSFDTPRELARHLVALAISSSRRPVRTALDPACGTGALLVALAEAGIDEILGSDLDPAALAVGRIAAPRARLSLADGLAPGPTVDAIVANPPFVAPELQGKSARQLLRKRFPWLGGRFDLAAVFVAAMGDRIAPGGSAAWILPFPMFTQPYGASIRERWLREDRICALEGPIPFSGAQIDVGMVAVTRGAGPASLPSGVAAEAVLALPGAPLDPCLQPSHAEIVARIRSACVPLGSLALVDTGVVSHGPDGGKARLLHDDPGPGRVPYADAREFFAGARRWLDYDPPRMHRAKDPASFLAPKVVIQRLRGGRPVRAAIDRDGVFVGHTCTIVVPRDARLSVEAVLALVTDPLVAGYLAIERGRRLDLYPHDLAAIPVPPSWLAADPPSLAVAWGLSSEERALLSRMAPPS
jgi:SAM-dependent methyltransferase